MQNRLQKLKNTRAENLMQGDAVNFSQLLPGAIFPLMIMPKFSGLVLAEWIKENAEWLSLKLKKHGAVLFRGFDVDTVQKFQHFITAFDEAPLQYTQRPSPRYEVAENVYHSTTYPADQIINMHSENSYAVNWPMKIIFCCIQPAEQMGETPIADNRLVLNYMSSELKDKFLQKQVKYVRNISPALGLGWQEVFQTTDRGKVEEDCKKSGMTFQWEEGDRLILSWNKKAIYDHPQTDEPIWFNHAFFFNKYALEDDMLSSFDSEDQLPFNTQFGDGSEISKEEIQEIRSAYQKASVVFPWEKGDVLYMDNMLMAHGRNAYKGSRQIVVSMF